MDKKRILILEDDLKTVVILTSRLSNFFIKNESNNEMEKVGFDMTVIGDSGKAKIFIDSCEDGDFDCILLDRDCASGDSFHRADIGKFNPNKIISISSVPEFNQAAQERFGINKQVEKHYGNLEDFGEKVMDVIKVCLAQ